MEIINADLRKIVETQNHKKPNTMISNPECNSPLNHKDFFITKDYFDSKQIPSIVIVQRAGEIVVTNSHGLHSVSNSGDGLCEAVNASTNSQLKACKKSKKYYEK